MTRRRPIAHPFVLLLLLLLLSLLPALLADPSAAASGPAPRPLEELRQEIGAEFPLVVLVHRAPRIHGETFDPVALVRAVNALLPLGKERALSVLRTYHRVATSDPIRRERYDLDEQRIFLLVRLLCIRSDGDPSMPPLLIGAPDVVGADPRDWPLFPLVLERDVPFLLTFGYTLAGKAESPLAHIAFCAEQGRLRDRPLAPAVSPMAALARIEASAPWQHLFSASDEARRRHELLRHQAARALGDLREEGSGVRWDAKRQAFIRRNRSR